MSEKTELPEEVLDAISGGVITLNGEPLSQVQRVNHNGIYV